MHERKSIGSMVQRGLTPLLDTLFILLFALLALSDTRQVTEAQEVRIQLPEVEASESSPPTAAQRVSILVDAESAVRLSLASGEPELIEDLEQLDAVLTSRLGDTPPGEVTVDIVGDAGARHGVVVELLQHLRLRGFSHVQLLAIRSPSESSEVDHRWDRGERR